MTRARVLLAEDHAPVAEQLRELIETEFDVISVVGDGAALLDAAQRLQPDVIVTDVAMPKMDGLQSAERTLRDRPDARIVFISLHNDAALIQRAFDIGGMAYVLKPAAGDQLLPAIRAALLGARTSAAGSH